VAKPQPGVTGSGAKLGTVSGEQGSRSGVNPGAGKQGFNPQPDPPKDQARVPSGSDRIQEKGFNPQPDPPKESTIASRNTVQQDGSGTLAQQGKLSIPFDISIVNVRVLTAAMQPLPVDSQTRQPMVKSGDSFGIRIVAREKLADPQSPALKTRFQVTCGAQKLLDETRQVGYVQKAQTQTITGKFTLANPSDQAMTCDLQVTVMPESQGAKDQAPADNTARATFRLAGKPGLKPGPAMKEGVTTQPDGRR
jgi:hypothetical protein